MLVFVWGPASLTPALLSLRPGLGSRLFKRLLVFCVVLLLVVFVLVYLSCYCGLYRSFFLTFSGLLVAYSFGPGGFLYTLFASMLPLMSTS